MCNIFDNFIGYMDIIGKRMEENSTCELVYLPQTTLSLISTTLSQWLWVKDLYCHFKTIFLAAASGLFLCFL